MRRLLTITAPVLFAAAAAHAQSRGAGSAGTSARGGGIEIPAGALQADSFQSTWGMSAPDLYKFHFTGTLADAPLSSYKESAEAFASAAPSDAGSFRLVEPIRTETAVANDGRSRTRPDAGLPAPKRGLFDAPGPIPLPRQIPPPLKGPGALERIGSAIRGGADIGAAAITPAPEPGRRLIENLKLPAVVQPKDVPDLTPETALSAGGADFSRRVIGERSAPAAPMMSPAAGPAAQAHPLPVLVEVRLSAGGGDPVAAIERQAGVVVDRAFPTFYSSAGRQTAFVRAWADPERLLDLTLHPAVARLAVINGAAPAVIDPGLSVPVALHLRLPAAEKIDAFLTRSVTGLEGKADFKWRVARGYQIYPTPFGTTVVLTGDLPSASFDRLLAYPDLVRVEPYVAAERLAETAAAASAPKAAARPSPRAARGPGYHAAKQATDVVVLSTAYPWMGIMMREIFFWIEVALYPRPSQP